MDVALCPHFILVPPAPQHEMALPAHAIHREKDLIPRQLRQVRDHLLEGQWALAGPEELENQRFRLVHGRLLVGNKASLLQAIQLSVTGRLNS